MSETHAQTLSFAKYLSRITAAKSAVFDLPADVSPQDIERVRDLLDLVAVASFDFMEDILRGLHRHLELDMIQHPKADLKAAATRGLFMDTYVDEVRAPINAVRDLWAEWGDFQQSKDPDAGNRLGSFELGVGRFAA